MMGSEGISAPGIPPGVTCYICGRRYGTASIEIHIQQCKELFVAREMKKDRSERLPLPKDPALSLTNGTKKASEMTKDELAEVNRLADEAAANALAQCEFCGRRFAPEKLPIHNKACTKEHPSKRSEEGAAPRNKDPIANGTRADFTKTEPMPSQTRPRTSGGILQRQSSKMGSTASALPGIKDANFSDVAESSPPSASSRNIGRPKSGRTLPTKGANTVTFAESGGDSSAKDNQIAALADRIEAVEANVSAMQREISALKAEMSKLRST